jgi:D-aspartate ligase
VRTLSERRAALNPNILLSFPEDGKVRMLLDKSVFYRHAAERGFRIAPMYGLTDWSTDRLERQAQFPCILKTAAKMYVPGMQKAYRIADAAQLRQTVRHLAALEGLRPQHLVLQEWVPGGDGDVVFCMQYYGSDGQPMVSFVGRKIRQWRPETGGTASAEPWASAEAVAETTRFFTGLGMRGICSMEFKRSPADGRLYMIEPTVGRADYQEGVAVANGSNIPYAAYCDAAGKPYRPGRAAAKPVKWVNAGSDFRAASWYVGQGRLSWRAWLGSLRGRRAYAIFTAREPWPFLELLRRKAHHRMRRVWS